jgi:WD40 repeat protein
MNKLILSIALLFAVVAIGVSSADSDTLWCHYTYPNSIYAVKFTPNGQYIATGGSNGVVTIWNALTGDSVKSYTNDGEILSFDISSDGNLIAISNYKEDSNYYLVRIYNFQTNSLITTVTGRAIKFSPDGNYLVTSDGNIYETQSWNKVGSFTLQKNVTIADIDISPDNNYVAIASYNYNDNNAWISNGITLYFLSNLKDTTFYKFKQGSATNKVKVCFSPDGKYLAEEAADDTIRIWTLPDRTIYRKFCHYNEVDAIAFSPDGKYLVEGGGTYNNKRLNIWDINSGSIKYTYNLNWLVIKFYGEDEGDIIYSISTSTDLKKIATAGSMGFYMLNANYNSVSIKENPISTQTIYPNPTNGLINIDLQCLNTNQSYEIYDNNSILLLNQTISPQSSLTIDFSQYSNGIYFIKLYCGNIVSTYKIVKEG